MVGLIGKTNNKGLGTATRGYRNNLKIDKYADLGCVPEDFFDNLDFCFVMEVYDREMHQKAHSKGCKIALIVNYEFLPERCDGFDYYICSSSLNYDSVQGNKVLIPYPIEDRPFKLRQKALTFVHNAGTLGVMGANGTKELLQAISLVTKPVKFIIRSQVPIVCNDPRVDLRIGNVPYETLFDEGDVFVMPHKFRATSIPIQEAMLSGMPVLSSDIKPFNEFVNFTFPVDSFERLQLTRPVLSAKLNPMIIAKAINDLYDKNIEEESKKARKYAEETFSWSVIKPKLEALWYN